MAHPLRPLDAVAGPALTLHDTTLGLAAAAGVVLVVGIWLGVRRLRGGDDDLEPTAEWTDDESDDDDGTDVSPTTDDDGDAPDVSVSYSPSSGGGSGDRGRSTPNGGRRSARDDDRSGAKAPDRRYKNVVRSNRRDSSADADAGGSSADADSGSSGDGSGSPADDDPGRSTGTGDSSAGTTSGSEPASDDSTGGDSGGRSATSSGSDGRSAASDAGGAAGGESTGDGPATDADGDDGDTSTDTRIYGGEFGGAAGETCPDCDEEIPSTGDYRFCPFCGGDL